MFMRKMRDSAKWVMLILALAFVGWLVFDWVASRGGDLGAQANPVIGEVAGREIRYDDWNRFLQSRLEVARQSGSLTEEQVRVATEEAWEELVSSTILQAEIDRLGLHVTDEEVRQAFLTRPPPELMSHPAFQTEGRFDLQKYQRFFADPAVDEQTLLGIESYYRSVLPRIKLQSLISEGIYVTEEEAWRFFRDTNERARVRFVRIDPTSAVPDTAASVTDAQVRDYYDEHRDEFERPASARVHMVSIPMQPSAADTASARTRIEELRQRILGGEPFAEVARAESGDTASARQGGDVGTRARDELQPAIADVAFSVPVGRVSEPVETPFGLHLVQVDERTADSVALRQIYVPVEMSRATEDSIFDLIDELEGIALRTDLPTAADSVGLPIRRDVVLSEDTEFVPGAGALGVAADWAIDDPEAVIGELSPFFENASGYHVFELLERRPAGVRPLAEVEPVIRQRLVAERKGERARELAARVPDAVAQGASFEEAAQRFGWSVEEAGPFTRRDFVPGLGQATEAIGAAFGQPIGEVGPPVGAGAAVAVLLVVERTEADRARFEEVKASLIQQLTLQRRQEYTDRWLAALRERGAVRDLRDRLQEQRAAAAS